ncbi:MAG: phosphoribosylformylglycinamidine synthase subunit PurS [Longimicrobiales bacterium]
MGEFKAEVRITPRAGLLDPEGHAVEGALRSLEFKGVRDVRVGRLVRVTVDASNDAEARTMVDAMCRSLLANPVTEDYQVAVEKAG